MPAGIVLLAMVAGLSACAKDAAIPLSPQAARGAQLAQSSGCLACHTTTGKPSMGPTWKGLLGSTRPLADGSSVVADEDYIRRSIADPAAQRTIGAVTVMPRAALTDEQIADLVAYISSL